jgi:hypothetical protein
LMEDVKSMPKEELLKTVSDSVSWVLEDVLSLSY